MQLHQVSCFQYARKEKRHLSREPYALFESLEVILMKFATQGMVRFYVNSFINTSIHLVCICHHIQYLLGAGDGDAAVVGGFSTEILL